MPSDSFTCPLILSGRFYGRQIDGDWSCPCLVQSDEGSAGCTLTGLFTDNHVGIGGGCILTGCFHDSNDTDATIDLVAWYPLSTDKTNDYTRNDYDGTASGSLATISGAFCSHCTAFSWFDLIALPGDKLTSNQSFSVSTWIKWDYPFQMSVIYDRGNFQLGVSWIGTIYAHVIGASTSKYMVWGTAQLGRKRWEHIAVSYTAGDGLRIYHDGQLERYTALGETLAGAVAPTIGQFLQADLQHLRIYGDARSGDWWQAEWMNGCYSGFFTSH